jgi:putative PEP-CTERM system histidine kinase
MVESELVGIITLADRVNGIPLSFEETEMLTTIAYQVSASLQNHRLSEQLQEAKEAEAFQMIAAVFVHDMKNTASKLSLLLQSLPVHFDNPEFREDALRAISQSVEKINQICTRLSVVRQTVDLEQEQVDLNEVVHSTLDGLQVFTNGHLLEVLKPLPRVPADPEQIRKLLTNLVMNASQATGKTGEIRVETGTSNDWAVLTVKDNGNGISKAFLEHDLFRPFRTNKAQGTGIGLFHSKMIVDAHRGKIEVDSQEGVGTTVRVLLPLTPSTRSPI